MGNLRKMLPLGVHAVVGTTGFSDADLKEVDELARKHNTSLLIAPNFALGAVVMMKLACEAAKYFPHVEIIEKHHDNKLDAPSGTAIITAQKIAEVRKAMASGNLMKRKPGRCARCGLRGHEDSQCPLAGLRCFPGGYLRRSGRNFENQYRPD